MRPTEYIVNLNTTEFGILDSSLDLYAKQYEKKLAKLREQNPDIDFINKEEIKFADKINSIKSLHKKLARCLVDGGI